MNTSENKYDAIERIIFDTNLSIKHVEVKSDIDKLLVFLNTNHILAFDLSSFKGLKNASAKDLKKFELIGNGTGIHWTNLDEDLSLKGFLKNALQKMVTEPRMVIA